MEYLDFRKTMRWVLSERAADEPGVGPGEHLGQWVLPDKRGLGRIEPDTALEKRLWTALEDHYVENDSGELAGIWGQLMQLSRDGLYKDWLQPPTGPVYRGITVRPGDAAKLLRVPEKRIFQTMGTPRVVKSKGTYQPWDSPVTSWTTDCQLAQTFAPLRANWVSIIFRAQCAPNGAGGGEFLMNPRVIPDEFPEIGRQTGWDSAMVEEEEEVISYGPVEWDAAGWIFADPSWRLDWDEVELPNWVC